MKKLSTSPIFTKALRENHSRRIRGELISKIESIVNGKVICYFANPKNQDSLIDGYDTIALEDLLRSTSDSKIGFLILNSNGGNANVAEKLLSMCRSRFTEKFTIIVPNYAKSAATMMCLGADSIMMGYLAELGPIDPQISIRGDIQLPARSFIDGLEMVRQKIKEGDPSIMYSSMLQKVRPEIISMCASAIAHSEEFAKKWLTEHMLKNDPEHAKKVAKWLSDGQTYKSHGKVIDFYEAKNVLRIKVERIDPDSELWALIWDLYVHAIVDMEEKSDSAKLLESTSISLLRRVSRHKQE